MASVPRHQTMPSKVIEGMNRGDYIALRAELAAEHCGICPYCGNPFPTKADTTGQWAVELLTVDHIVSRWDGGTDDRDNLAPACYSCNSRKANRTLLAFLALPPLERRERWRIRAKSLNKKRRPKRKAKALPAAAD